MATLGPCTLEGTYIRLEPLRTHHSDGLLEAIAGQDPAMWDWMPRRLTNKGALDQFLSDALQAESFGEAFTFAVVLKLKSADRIVGSTRYMDVQPEHRGVEIGWTWYVRDVWGTVVNLETKYLLLAHAFEKWQAVRVALKTDHKNLRSQAAIKKLGAKYEGTLRNHRIRPDGTFRDTVIFSILDREWNEAKEFLLQRMEEARKNQSD